MRSITYRTENPKVVGWKKSARGIGDEWRGCEDSGLLNSSDSKIDNRLRFFNFQLELPARATSISPTTVYVIFRDSKKY
jgi:hypothetical protein